MASYAITPSGDVILMMTKAEAKGLQALADEGAAGLLADARSARSYIGGPSAVEAAKRALEALNGASVQR
ncbi:MAG: hypothetical protein E6Q67_03040 [Roseateles sp.]|nr:MAG: hypothetical protein E6Q67_03040 [Roseateles sp.]